MTDLSEARRAMVVQQIDEIDAARLDALLERIGDAQVVLLGEASHGTSEFYRMRARITQALIERKGFDLVAVEADWPDAARIDHYVRHRDAPAAQWKAFGRFPQWMWRNEEVDAFVARGEDAKAVVWAHNSHIGDARYTEMSARGEHNLGQLCAQQFAGRSFRLGFGTDSGTVAAADDWDAPMRIMDVRPAHPESYERQCHESGLGAFLLPLADDTGLRRELLAPRLERAIGVIYRPHTEIASHYFQAVLPRQFDAYCWFDRSSAIRPLDSAARGHMPETYPFGL